MRGKHIISVVSVADFPHFSVGFFEAKNPELSEAKFETKEQDMVSLGGGFKDFFCSSLFGEDSHFD